MGKSFQSLSTTFHNRTSFPHKYCKNQSLNTATIHLTVVLDMSSFARMSFYTFSIVNNLKPIDLYA